MKPAYIALLSIACLLQGCPDDDAPIKPDKPGTSSSSEAASSESSDKPKKAGKGGAKSPKAAFAKVKKAASNEDWEGLFVMLTKEPQNKMLAGMLLGAAITTAPIGTKANPGKKDKLEAILKKHGVSDMKSGSKGGNPKDLMSEMAAKLDGVKDRPGLFSDLMKFLEENSLRQDRHEVISMDNLKEDGDKATATIVLKNQAGKTIKENVELHRVDGRWYFHILEWK